MVAQEQIQQMHNALVSLVRVAITRLYRLPVEVLKVANPSMEEIARLCALFNKIVEGTDIDGIFTEAIDVLREAAEAVRRSDESCLKDCAYQLEDFLGRLTPKELEEDKA